MSKKMSNPKPDFNKPPPPPSPPKVRKCRHMTEYSYPDKIDVYEFAKEIKRDIGIFVTNMKNLESMKDKRLWAEDWMETFQSWMEMEKDD